jgi:hypothetical protein
MSDWQPMETAPRGMNLFVFGSVESGPFSRPHIGSEDVHEVFWDGGGWQCRYLDGWVPEPSHWMHKPEPPTPQEGE